MQPNAGRPLDAALAAGHTARMKTLDEELASRARLREPADALRAA
jgi:hypothetical protein